MFSTGVFMRTNFVLVDLENVQPDRLALLDKDHFKVKVFVGANQSKISVDAVLMIHQLGERAEYIKITGAGPNSLDFHIAFYIGYIAATEPSACFHIISKDKGFDPLIEHLKDKKILVTRKEKVADISIVKRETAKTPAERMTRVLERLKSSRPRTLAKLNNTIATLFHKQLSEEDLQNVVQALLSDGHITVTDNKLSYAIP